MEKIIKKDGVYVDGRLWREKPINPKKFHSLRPLLPEIKAAYRQYYNKHKAVYGDCYPYLWSDDEWIIDIINAARIGDSNMSDADMVANPRRVFALSVGNVTK